ncbi:hypothetical protein B0H17DRAFT_1199562 [Mycena rosella]|uniref:CST complex subunit STN1 n=1 Tax=Mycena rosella TaxID=1033263 RepID=A0AAD7GKX4_MYCRO|nr:hypothetical protein B0H17DRAFT_1199562 [Mycena rosella]
MRGNRVKDPEFFWLGRVPCRSVKLVGLVVGVQTFETRIVYSVDDCTAVIECLHRPPPPPPNASKSKQEKVAKPEPSPILKPVAYVGCSVIVTGRVEGWHDTRRILVDSIVRCPSANDEPRHWIAVRDLHTTHYSLDEPFTIPVRPASQPPTSTNAAPATPSSSGSAPSSPAKSTASHASPHKLRHPAKLRTKELTDNAFRIYVKHFMDNAGDVRPVPPEPTTPTKSYSRLPLGDETPRPHDRTPQRITPLDFTRPLVSQLDAEPTSGFTIPYLRRVPELALMAKRVVKAEAKGRAREARKKAKAGESVIVTKTMHNDQGKLHPRMKRLFNWAILELVKEGDVISWDGPARSCGGRDDAQPGADTSVLWRANSSASTAGGNSTVMSSASVAEDDEDEGELTDPGEDEEVFLPLTPAFLATRVETAIATLVKRATERMQASKDANRPRLRAPAAGPTVREIVAHLKSDDMWRNLSEFAVKEALAFLQDEGRAWMLGDRWELAL